MAERFPVPDVVVDTGMEGCGQLIMTLFQRFATIPLGQIVMVMNYDRGTREDLPAWCRMRGHTLLGMEPVGDDNGTLRFFIRAGQNGSAQ